MAHAKRGLGGSVAARTINCPGWRFLPQPDEGERTSSEYADEGTMLHEAVRLCLATDQDADQLLGWAYSRQELTEEHIKERLAPSLAAFDAEIALDAELWLEQSVELPIPGAFGTADVVALEKDRLVILDWKFGVGIPVRAEFNDQLQFYAVGVLQQHPDLPEDFPVDLAVVQNGALSKWRTSVAALRLWLASYRIALEQDHLKLGKWCKFCPAAASCPLMQDTARQALSEDALSVEQSLELVEALERAGWVTAVKARAAAIKRADPAALPGWKLVAGRRTRQWADPEDAERWMEACGVDPRPPGPLLSPSKMEKELEGQGSIPDGMVVFSTPEPVLVRAEDKRAEWQDPLAGISEAFARISASLGKATTVG